MGVQGAVMGESSSGWLPHDPDDDPDDDPDGRIHQRDAAIGDRGLVAGGRFAEQVGGSFR
jgi:hypothetical protein